MSQIQELRTKIKKIKYKIEKQEKSNTLLTQHLQQLKILNSQQLTLQRVLKKISMMLAFKGMSINDWLLCISYEKQQYLQNYLQVLDKIGVKLDRGEKSLLTNFITSDLTQRITIDLIQKLAVQFGIRI